ncbi:Uncharacterized protein YKR070W, partial [Durusdinium trenchii]
MFRPILRAQLAQPLMCKCMQRRNRIGVVLDIDGVVKQGKRAIPGAREALIRLREERVPFIFMTNGGGNTEAQKAAELGELLEFEGICSEQMLLSHTPFRPLAERFRQRRVLLVGSAETAQVARSYGFAVGTMAVRSTQIVKGTEDIFPWPRATCDLPAINVNAPGEPPIEAVLIFYEPADWALELQVITDVLAGGHPLGAEGAGAAALQRAEVYSSNSDFLWQAGYPVPRFGNGAFVCALQELWLKRSGSPLQIQEYGKPYAVQFQAARQLLSQVAKSNEFEQIYMIGDNPKADVRGANFAGDPWRSMLVCTGVYQAGVHSNDPEDTAWRVVPDVSAAVELLLEK